MPRGGKAGNTTVWDDKARSDLLMALLTVKSPSKEEWDKAMPLLREKGYNYTPSAAM